jgi:hypothetical protein
VDTKLSVVIQRLEQFAPLDDEGDTNARLYEIFEGFRELPDRSPAMPAIYSLVERFPEAELGSPGPLVHELEAIAGCENLLRESMRRQPTLLTLWMVNRRLNSNLSDDERAYWLNELATVKSHPRAGKLVKDEAESFLRFQRESH